MAEERKSSDRATRIAEKIVEEAMRVAFTPDEEEAAAKQQFVSLAGVTNVVIRVVFPVVKGKRTAVTRRIRKENANFDRHKEQYRLEDVKRLLSLKPPRVQFTQLRLDGKGDPRNICEGFTEEMAIDAIRRLTSSDFVESKPRFNSSSHPVDVYITREKHPVANSRLYIKFYVDGNSLVFVESFHKNER